MKQDEHLPRFQSGHDVVRYFYGAIRLIPKHLLDTIFERGISVTMVKGLDLLVYQVRAPARIRPRRSRLHVSENRFSWMPAGQRERIVHASLVVWK